MKTVIDEDRDSIINLEKIWMVTRNDNCIYLHMENMGSETFSFENGKIARGYMIRIARLMQSEDKDGSIVLCWDRLYEDDPSPIPNSEEE